MLKGDCRICVHGSEPEDSEICVECGIARENYAPIKKEEDNTIIADDYISREAAKAILKQHEYRFTCADEADGFGEVKWGEYVIYADMAQNCIGSIPAADVQPVVHAYWTNKERYHSTLFGNCSNCGESSVADPYCSHCGAKMDGKVGKTNA